MRRLVRTPWFGDKRVGFGLSPRTWQGWGLTAGFAVLIAGTIRFAGLTLAVRGAAAAAEVVLFVVAAIATSSWLPAR
ncbi:MAG: hypothetical protein J2P40_10335 [Candidatus Dormibacteraeota bacterium]|nr:hypothetical protein [Candidatus Dormibacteraeota bacterium]MBO0761659.1 hypothetical protein [Candidatus Dormibacteraeota bacterium]